jgi:hypothetical protein
VVYLEWLWNAADRSRSFIWSLVTVIIGRMLLNLRGVSTPAEWENANDANLNAILHDLPVLIIGNPNRDINSQGEIVENEPTYIDGGWPENYEMARSRSEKEFFDSGEPGDVTNPEESQSLGIKAPKGVRRASGSRGHAHDLKVGGSLLPIASGSGSGSGSAVVTPSSSPSPRTLVHQPRPQPQPQPGTV